ncbi:GyrI-like domain-containing protein [Aliiglaciecola sp. 3_MG-2023]|uniref:GyrI-like domain-containing protein n=1 Tax=Aliiglaciecola sp. 3_MG-2023 TaxID=3062644 RepID=UPI0026E419AF|nr:GyrI-like domain-containing protein [Aliiglaciecola sp. 3_MG-2023]MDO6692664.1 GyrI-like domain-containing protein [Aliiglaciecola sp. 3_MG-2023]
MELRIASEKMINGISTRTNNAVEMSPNGKIPALWSSFDATIPVDYKNGERVYGVYYNYESDHNGMFTVLAGFDGQSIPSNPDIEQIIIPKAKYLVFSHKGEMPQIAIDAWTEVWEYFSNGHAEHQRLFTTDFEFYPNGNEIEVHIAVK